MGDMSQHDDPDEDPFSDEEDDEGVSLDEAVRQCKMGDLFWGMLSFLVFVTYLTWANSDPFYGAEKCVVISCNETSIGTGEGKIALGLECFIEKHNCSTNCHLETRPLSRKRLNSLKLLSDDDCKYKNGEVYLGRESYRSSNWESNVSLFGGLAVILFFLGYWVRLSYQLDRRALAARELVRDTEKRD